MNKKIKEFFDLSIYLSKSGFKLRNEGSILGVFWYILNPILFFILLFIVFSKNMGLNIYNYATYLFIGIIMFNLFQNITIESTYIIKSNRHLFKSINFPRATFIVGNVFKFFYSHSIEFIVLIFFSIIIHQNLSNIFIYPIILIFFLLFITGISLILSSISIFLVDTKNIWEFMSKLLWFGTPIFYELEKETIIYNINLFNPLYYFITISRDVLIYNKIPEIWIIITAIGISLFFIILGTIIFEKLKYKFMERI
jgi:ABC-type polysaccharide/polyol phosphate export permease